MIELNEETLEKMPELKRRLINYCMTYYEEAYDIRTEYLIAEYYLLERQNRLGELFFIDLLYPSLAGLPNGWE